MMPFSLNEAECRRLEAANEQQETALASVLQETVEKIALMVDDEEGDHLGADIGEWSCSALADKIREKFGGASSGHLAECNDDEQAVPSADQLSPLHPCYVDVADRALPGGWPLGRGRIAGEWVFFGERGEIGRREGHREAMPEDWPDEAVEARFELTIPGTVTITVINESGRHDC